MTHLSVHVHVLLRTNSLQRRDREFEALREKSTAPTRLAVGAQQGTPLYACKIAYRA
jgi:hypothetical protein